jgi:plastocyanin
MRSRVIVLLAVAACGETTPPNGGPVETREVTIVDNAFEPPDIIVREGDTVTWTWAGFDVHTVVFDDGSILPATARAVGTHQVVFRIAGTYPYFCSVHGRSVMSGTVEVRQLEPEPG